MRRYLYFFSVALFFVSCAKEYASIKIRLHYYEPLSKTIQSYKDSVLVFSRPIISIGDTIYLPELVVVREDLGGETRSITLPKSLQTSFREWAGIKSEIDRKNDAESDLQFTERDIDPLIYQSNRNVDATKWNTPPTGRGIYLLTTTSSPQSNQFGSINELKQFLAQRTDELATTGYIEVYFIPIQQQKEQIQSPNPTNPSEQAAKDMNDAKKYEVEGDKVITKNDPSEVDYSMNLRSTPRSNRLDWNPPPNGVNVREYRIIISEANGTDKGLNKKYVASGKVNTFSFSGENGRNATYKYKIVVEPIIKDSEMRVNVESNSLTNVEINCE